MKRIRLLILCFILATTTLAVFAQSDAGANPPPAQTNGAMRMGGRRGFRGRPGMRGQRDFMRSLNLTKEQRQKMKPIMQAQRDQMRKVWQDQSLTRAQMREKMRTIHQNTASQMRAMLTPDQQQKWDAHEKMMAQRMQQMRERRRQRMQQNGNSSGN